jgi:protein-S-isoprenylcysteine O-methyltransferase Ste14
VSPSPSAARAVAAPASAVLIAKRPRYTRWLVLALCPLVAVSSPLAGRPEWLAELFESLGIICLVVCLVGRGWASVYVAGRKNHELVVLGPYSIVRNPLYVFSFIGVLGIGLVSGMMTLLLAAAVAFAAFYRVVVRREEAYLAGLHGGRFARYAHSVPRWFPKFSAWRDVPALEVQPRLIAIHLRDSGLFFLAYLFFEMRDLMQALGMLPALVHLP